MNKDTIEQRTSFGSYEAHLQAVRRCCSNAMLRFGCILILLMSLWFAGQAVAAGDAELQVKTTVEGGIVTVERILDDSRVLISVRDASKKPLMGLYPGDFIVTDSVRTAKVLSVQPLSESLDVQRHIVLVLDNSDSMRQRNAIEPLLAGVDELLKIIRPIDQVYLVFFSDSGKITVDGRDLHVWTFRSSDREELKKIVSDIYRDSITATTVLYEGMLAGLGLIRTMPANEPRFLVVFSDGEDLNSSFRESDVRMAASGLGRFHAYGIDYMPGPEIDPFLTELSESNHGEVWKATSETNLVPIFQSVASKMQYYYVVSYLFPTTGSLTVAPASLTIDDVVDYDASSPESPSGVSPAAGASIKRRIDSSALTLHPVFDSAYGIANWKITLLNNDAALAVKAGEGSPDAEIVMPLNTEHLDRLAGGGDIIASMEVEDRKGQTIVLTAPPVKVNHYRTAGTLGVEPAVITIEEIKTIDSSPMLAYIYFAEGASDIPDRYVRLSGGVAAASFDEQLFRGTLEKYYQMLNIIGKRLTDHPAASITLTGCNANTGVERGNRKLSTARAEAVREYLQTVWNVAPERIRIEARNLPEAQSTGKLEEGRAENRRVEIRSDVPAILAPARSTYLATKISTSHLILRPVVSAPHGVLRWTALISNSRQILGVVTGEGDPPKEITIPLKTNDLTEMAGSGDVTVRMSVQDRTGQELGMTALPIRLDFIRTSRQVAQQQDFRVQEKYALILFDFDSDAISARNQDIVNVISTRIGELPLATTDIVGHTDAIGKEDYNIKLSEHRAEAVYKLLAPAYAEIPGEQIRFRGVGPVDPLYDNMSPEARAFNRTVTITLEYMAKD